jgi:hypothetical protein
MGVEHSGIAVGAKEGPPCGCTIRAWHVRLNTSEFETVNSCHTSNQEFMIHLY